MLFIDIIHVLKLLDFFNVLAVTLIIENILSPPVKFSDVFSRL